MGASSTNEPTNIVRFPPPKARSTEPTPRPAPIAAASGSAEAEACPRCGGAGFYVFDVPFGNPNFARPIKCDCRVEEERHRRVEDLRRLSDLDPFINQTFDNFDSRRRGIGEAFAVAQQFANDPYGWLIFVGPTGCGKTHLAAAIANSVLARRMQVLFAVAPELLDELRNTYTPGSDAKYSDVLEGIRGAPLLIIDDLGTEYPSAWAGEKLYQIFNWRYNNRLPTVVTMNPRAWQDLDERVKSRTQDGELARVLLLKDVSDFRPLKARPERSQKPSRGRHYGPGASR